MQKQGTEEERKYDLLLTQIETIEDTLADGKCDADKVYSLYSRLRQLRAELRELQSFK